MNREIKFRVWDNVGKQFVYLVQFNYEFVKSTTMKRLILYSPEEYSNLMQYIGLKDKNDKDIYEGDIVIDLSKFAINQKRIGIIEYKDSAYYKHTVSIQGKKANYYEPFPFSKDYAIDNSIIGNIYENPELLNN